MCSLCFDIEENIIIRDFASLRFDNLWHLPLMFLDVSALQRNVLLLEVSTLQGPELHLDVSALREVYVLLLEVSAKGPELHLDVSTLQRDVLLLEVSSLQGPELHLDVSALQRYMSNPQRPVQ